MVDRIIRRVGTSINRCQKKKVCPPMPRQDTMTQAHAVVDETQKNFGMQRRYIFSSSNTCKPRADWSSATGLATIPRSSRTRMRQIMGRTSLVLAHNGYRQPTKEGQKATTSSCNSAEAQAAPRERAQEVHGQTSGHVIKAREEQAPRAPACHVVQLKSVTLRHREYSFYFTVVHPQPAH